MKEHWLFNANIYKVCFKIFSALEIYKKYSQEYVRGID